MLLAFAIIVVTLLVVGFAWGSHIDTSASARLEGPRDTRDGTAKPTG